jgi:hypothetical protein
LIDVYEYLTIKDLTVRSLNDLTGFGYNRSCTLCISVGHDCTECIHCTDKLLKEDENNMFCLYGNSTKTYQRLDDEGVVGGVDGIKKTPRMLLYAAKARAKYLRSILTERDGISKKS